MTTAVIEQLSHDWWKSGIEWGDTVLLHSNISRTLRRMKDLGAKPSVEAILDSFLHAVGPKGTLLLPLFNFEFTQGTPFNIASSQSSMGALTEVARKRQGAVRSGHPIYSFAALGARSDAFAITNDSGYGGDSPFGILHRMDGKVASLDLPDQNSMTFYHYVEEAMSVPYRYHKRFHGSYTGWDGVTSERSFGLFVRDIERGVRTAVDPMGERLWSLGLYQGQRPKQGSGLRTIRAVSLFDATKNVIESGGAEGTLYRIEL